MIPQRAGCPRRKGKFPVADIVNPQITDAVTQTNVKVLAEAPAMSMGALYQSLAHSMGLLFENAVAAQQQQQILAQAATAQGVTQIYSLGAASLAGRSAEAPGAPGEPPAA